jgi:acyl-CoA reductase-like NAD-dependent aldehyde dehydrogenase
MNVIDCISPNDSLCFGQVAETDIASLSIWSNRMAERVIPSSERPRILKMITYAIRRDEKLLTEAIVKEAGKTLSEAKAEIDYAAAFVESAQRIAEAELKCHPLPFQVPFGISLLITAYNDPLAGITRKLAFAIAAGCPVIIKPSALGAYCARELERSITDATGDWVTFAFLSDNKIAEQLIQLEGIRCVSMTGSTYAGRRVALASANRLLPCILELGGNCPFVIFEDANLESTIRDLLIRKTRAAGQACSAVNRVLVSRAIIKEFTSLLLEQMEYYPCGQSDGDVVFGPVRSLSSLNRLNRLMRHCMDSGQLIGRGPKATSTPSCLVFPVTAVSVSSASDPLVTAEAFGPLFTVASFQDDNELDAILAANRHNLVLYLYGTRADAFLKTRSYLRYGSVGLNTINVQGTDIPTGGFGDAGYGREGGLWGVNSYRSTVNIREAKS